MMQPTARKTAEGIADPPGSIDETMTDAITADWFVAGERISVPPRSTRRPISSSPPPPEPTEPAVPLGDALADDWFR